MRTKRKHVSVVHTTLTLFHACFFLLSFLQESIYFIGMRKFTINPSICYAIVILELSLTHERIGCEPGCLARNT